MNTLKHTLTAALIAVTTQFGSNAWADLTIDISEAANGGSVFELTGTGTVLGINNSNTGATVINFVTATDTFVVDGGSSLASSIDDSLSQAIKLGNSTTLRAFVTDLDGIAGHSSRLGLGVFEGVIFVGDELSDMNGVYVADMIPFNIFVEGSYNVELGFLTSGSSVTDVGEITINVYSDLDSDDDGINDVDDNCPSDFNPDQLNTDGDLLGDACDTDDDNDNVLDVTDVCPMTNSSITVDGGGCSIAQLCPTDEGNWNNHGAYVRCVTHSARDFTRFGLITKAERKAIVSAAAKSNVGKKK